MREKVATPLQELFSLEKNPNLRMEEFDAMLSEFRTDYNQTHFVRNETFKKAADGIQVRRCGRHRTHKLHMQLGQELLLS